MLVCPRLLHLLIPPIVLACSSPAGAAVLTPQLDASAARKSVLVELFTSQGCDLCPTAELLLGKLADEFGPDRVVPVAFHVDYFNEPWKDPYSDPIFSRRELQYSILYARANNLKNEGHLYLTPLLMVGGQVPMVGSNADAPAKARAAIRAELSKPAEVAMEAILSGGADAAERSKTLDVVLRASGPRWADQRVLVETVITEDALATDVQSGELKGRTYHARHVARKFAFQHAQLPGPTSDPLRQAFSLQLEPGWDPARVAVIVFVQDESTGQVLQARRLAWNPSPAKAAGAERTGTGTRR